MKLKPSGRLGLLLLSIALIASLLVLLWYIGVGPIVIAVVAGLAILVTLFVLWGCWIEDNAVDMHL